MTDQIDWSHYRSFLAVLQRGSLSAAARELGLTQPTIGRHIGSLEGVAGTPLFVRSQQGLVPTATAREMAPYAEAMASSAAALMRAAMSHATEPEGTVRISASEVVGIEVLPPVIADLQRRHQKLAVELSVSDTVEDLSKQEADIAVRMVAPKQEALVSRRIGAVRMGFFARSDYLERHGRPKTSADLAGHQIIGFDKQLVYIRAVLKDRPELAALRFGVRSDSNLAQFAMIRAGAGIGICQIPMGRRHQELEQVLEHSLDFSLELYVVMHESLRTSPRCRVTFDALVAGLGAYVASQREG